MREFARVRLEDAEKGVHDVLRRHGHSCPVEVHTVDLGDTELKHFPFIRFSVWLQYLGLTRIMRQLCGVCSFRRLTSVLDEFWRRFRAINPYHQIFEMSDAGTIDLKVTIPYYSHSDEGRSYKKEALWIFSVHGAIGRGTRNYLKKGKQRSPIRRNQMGMNFVGSTLGSQFMFATMLREVAGKNPGSLEKLLEIFAEDAAALARDGLTIEGVKLWFLHIGNKGDLPALAKVASLKRKFYNCPRAPRSKKACIGVCHQCLAGQEADPSKGMVAYPSKTFQQDQLGKQQLTRCNLGTKRHLFLEVYPLMKMPRANSFALTSGIFSIWGLPSISWQVHLWPLSSQPCMFFSVSGLWRPSFNLFLRSIDRFADLTGYPCGCQRFQGTRCNGLREVHVLLESGTRGQHLQP